MKKILDVLLILGLIVLGQLPMAVSMGLAHYKVNPSLLLLGGVLLNLLAIGIYLFVGYHRGLLTASFKKWYRHRLLLISVLGVVALIVVGILSNLVLFIEGAETTNNQAQVIELFNRLPKMLTFLFVVMLAPIGEEVICRGLIPSLFCAKNQLWGYVLGTLVFAFLHGPTNIGSWIAYGGMGAVLAWIRYYSKHLEYSILTHGLNNLIAYIGMLSI